MKKLYNIIIKVMMSQMTCRTPRGREKGGDGLPS